MQVSATTLYLMLRQVVDKPINCPRYDYGVNRAKPLGAEELAELEKRGILLKRKTLEEVFEETPQPEDDYEIVRGPRPWEDHPQKEQAQANKKFNGVKITPSYGL